MQSVTGRCSFEVLRCPERVVRECREPESQLRCPVVKCKSVFREIVLVDFAAQRSDVGSFIRKGNFF
jgi:hypothetical protein